MNLRKTAPVVAHAQKRLKTQTYQQTKTQQNPKQIL